MCILKISVLLIILCVVSANHQNPTSAFQHDAPDYQSTSKGLYSRYKRSNASCQPLNRRHRAVSGTCILPPYPRHGTYIASGQPNAKPGESYPSFKITQACRPGFGFLEPDGSGSTGLRDVYCLNGDWSKKYIYECVRFCKLDPDPSVEYTCRVPGAGFKICEGYVPPGSRVRPVCNSPIYYSTDGVTDMWCISGYWDNVAKCKAECGRVTPEAEQLVIGGDRAKRGELPWHAGIYSKSFTPYMQICGGSLVSVNLVISAAHCFWNDNIGKLPAKDFAVAIGKVYRPWNTPRDSTSAQTSDVKEIRIPRLFQGQAANLQEDIAVLILTTNIRYLTYVRPVCLNFDLTYEKWQLQHGKLGKVAGWGLTDTKGTASPVLKSVEIPYINEDICINTLPPSFREFITGDKFCAGYNNGTALCKGDSGGGLAFPDKVYGIDRFYLRGVVSAVPNVEEKACNDMTYTTFTKISKHEELIKEAFAASMNRTCPPNVFQCADGSCKDQGVDCNGRKDCADGSDESDELCVPAIPKTDRPDTYPSDLVDLVEILRLLNESNNIRPFGAIQNRICPLTVFQCADGSCKEPGVICNGRNDCADGSDEADELKCGPVKTPTISEPTISFKELHGVLEQIFGPVGAIQNRICPLTVFQCADGSCKEPGVICNGRNDCADGSDEADELKCGTVKTPTIAEPTISYKEVHGVLEQIFGRNETSEQASPECEPIPPELTSRKTGHISVDKCIEYQERFVYRCISKPRTTPHRSFVCSHNKRHQLILGGHSASSGDHTHRVTLGYKLPLGDIQWAWPGAIISETYVLTAASAVTSRNKFQLGFILTGSLTLELSERIDNTHRIKKITTHPEFQLTENYNDIALVEAEKPFPLRPALVPACLHTPTSKVDLDTVSPWTLEWHKQTDLFLKIPLKRMPDSSCAFETERKFPSSELPRGLKLETQICYEDVLASNETCVGNVGATVEMEGPDIHCMYLLLGVTSITRCKVNPVKDYGVFTKVLPFIPWIESVVWPS